MPLRSGQEYLKKENQPFKLILLSEKVPTRQYIVNIDFDDASKAWRKNKIYLGEGMFKYKRRDSII